MVEEIIYAFIDSQNLNLGTRSAGWILDFKKFRIYLKEKYHVQKAFLFIGYVYGNEHLYNYLKQSGFILIFKETLSQKMNKKTYIKGNVDAELVLQTLVEFNNYDKAIIVSGDGDFLCLIQYLKDYNKLLKIIVPGSKYSSLLRRFGEDIVNIEYIKNLLEK
jgi:uncharacterized LabA/DUF88 family protein